MKKILLVLAFLLCLPLCGCIGAVKTPSEDELMADIFDAIENEDFDSAREMLSGVVDEADLDKALPEMSDYISGTVSDYTKIGYYYNMTVSGGETLKSERLTYIVKTQYGEYVVEMVLLETADGWDVYGYHIADPSELPVSGYIIDFNNFNALQLIMLVFSAACIGFIIYTIVICAKSRIRLKPMWIILIILLQAGIILSKTGFSQSLRFMVLYFDISKLLKYMNGDYVFTLVIPVGAILFLCLRRRLISSAKAYYQRKAMFYAGYPKSPEPFGGDNTDNKQPADIRGQQPDSPETAAGTQENSDKEADKDTKEKTP